MSAQNVAADRGAASRGSGTPAAPAPAPATAPAPDDPRPAGTAAAAVRRPRRAVLRAVSVLGTRRRKSDITW